MESLESLDEFGGSEHSQWSFWKLPVPAYRDVEEQQQGTVFEHLTRGVVNRELHNSSVNTRLYGPDIDGSWTHKDRR